MLDIDFIPPTETYSIPDFVDQAGRLSFEDDKSDFAQFVLTGRLGDHQALLDPLRNIIPDDQNLTLKRDYDSLIGLSTEIVVTSELYVYPVAKRENTLTENVHLDLSVHRGDSVSAACISMPIHFIHAEILNL
jgi:hypothetical protein